MTGFQLSRSLPALAGIVVLGLSSLPTARAAAPPTAPEVVRDEDQPTRNPYQEVTGILGGGPCTTAGSCTFKFKPVPAHQRRRITYAACELLMSGPGGVSLVQLVGTLNNSEEAVEPLTTATQGDPTSVVAAGPVLLYLDAGQSALILVIPHTAMVRAGSLCTLAGSDVTLP